jgi:hypothetical protein
MNRAILAVKPLIAFRRDALDFFDPAQPSHFLKQFRRFTGNRLESIKFFKLKFQQLPLSPHSADFGCLLDSLLPKLFIEESIFVVVGNKCLNFAELVEQDGLGGGLHQASSLVLADIFDQKAGKLLKRFDWHGHRIRLGEAAAAVGRNATGENQAVVVERFAQNGLYPIA